MNKIKRISAVLLAVLFMLSAAACSATPSYSYKTNNAQYAEGVYIFSLFSAYNEAYKTVSEAEGDSFDVNTLLDYKGKFGDEDEEVICRDWILSEADKITRNLIVLDNYLAESSIELDPTLVENARTLAREDWYLGPYYEYYASMGYTSDSYEELLYDYGISFESFLNSTYLASVKQKAVFDSIYGTGGEKEVPDAEIKKYFEENYTSYAYFTVPLYETTIDESTSMQKSVAYTANQILAVKAELDSYVKLINSGTDYDTVLARYMKAHSITSDPSTRNTEMLSSSSQGEEIIEVLKKLKTNNADYVQVGEGETAVMYFIVKFDISKETESYIKESANRDNLLSAMKTDEFSQYLLELTETVECTVNQEVIDKYDPAMFVVDEELEQAINS